MDNTENREEGWTFFSNNAHVLICLTQTPQPTTREIAIKVGITERAVQRIVTKLIKANIVKIKKEGRRNRYELDLNQRLRHPLESHKPIGEFLRLMNSKDKAIE
ncbi:MAG: winged helix-turn-helix transcriptional regulator [Proteobacteria bacterium]|nr:winged helix-turn-helix transcriptional regulator [Pseudomonadota bacterium]